MLAGVVVFVVLGLALVGLAPMHQSPGLRRQRTASRGKDRGQAFQHRFRFGLEDEEGFGFGFGVHLGKVLVYGRDVTWKSLSNGLLPARKVLVCVQGSNARKAENVCEH